LLFYADGEKRYIIAPNGLQVGATLMSGAEAAPEIGNTLLWQTFLSVQLFITLNYVQDRVHCSFVRLVILLS
jgi:hypothetical protein